MKPNEKKPEFVYRIINRANGEAQGVYDRSYSMAYDFESPESARCANCHGVYKDRGIFAIAKYKVTYELIEEDVE